MKTMKLLISKCLLEELKFTIEDSFREDRTDPTDATYRKIAAGTAHKRGVTIEADFADLKELYLRAAYEIDTAEENLQSSYDPADRQTWRRLKTGWTGMRNKLTPYLVFERRPVKSGGHVVAYEKIPVSLI